ncbi:MAG: IS630 family transposase [Zavarzinella sp.]|nr:IS630 family transposase [Zavarzinella sp.]
MPHHAVLLFIDATTLRWFPPLRSAWGFRGEQVVVRITGRNAKRVVFGAINPRTGHRLVFRRFRQRQEDFQAFLRYLRRRYPGRPLWLLLDKAPCHDAVRSQQLAARLGVVLLWLPKQCPELNAMDQLFKDLKRLIAANRQFPTIDEEADHAERWILALTAQQALRKASVLSHDFWLKDFLEDFWLPT